MSAPTRYLLDTNVVSETRKTKANPHVMTFLERADATSLFISVLTIGELRKGLEIKRRSDRDAAMRLGTWIDGLESTFPDRSRPVIDTLIGATALVHDLTLVTRNVEDLRGIALPMVDPWQAEAGKAPTA